ncbi:MAG: PilN domain-containing protein [Gemmatimonadota bacterium]
MITINLRPGTKRASKGGASPFAGFATKFKSLGAGGRDPLLMGVAALWALVLLGGGYFFITTASKLAALEPQLETARAEQDRYKVFMRQKLVAERARDSILTQIGTISAVDRERYIWPHLLDDIGASLPEGTWITEISAVAPAPLTDTTLARVPSLRILGKTGDLANYTTFLRRLEASPWLQNVLPIEAKTVIEGNRALTTFIIQATYSQADSSMIRTVPILESVGDN